MESNGHQHVLQGATWARFQEELGRKPVELSGEGWSCRGYIVSSRGVTYLYCPYGPTLDKAGAMAEVVPAWEELGEKLDFVRFEPMGPVTAAELEELGARKVKDFQPRLTQVMDLTKSDEELWHDVESGHRNAINGAERRGLKFRMSTEPRDGRIFLNLLEETVKRTGFKAFSPRYLELQYRTLMPLGAMKLFIAEHEGRPVAASLGLDGETVRCYLHAAAAPEARKLKAPAPLVWQMMMDARAAGKTQFDLWGVSPAEEADHPWHGFSEFKRGFGGEQVEYMGTWELPLSKLKYRLLQSAKRFMGR
jgi:lipid II:glycine glycyltransferase (peptidoglycan interpeptide bridge formation enzyme)